MSKQNEEVEYFKRRDFASAHPKRARVLDDNVLSKYVSWAMVDRTENPAGTTYLLMNAAAYRKACEHYAPMTSDFAATVREKAAQPMREMQAEVVQARERMEELAGSVNGFMADREKFEKDCISLESSLKNARALKLELQRILEHINNGEAKTPAALVGYFARIDELAATDHMKALWRTENNRRIPNV